MYGFQKQYYRPNHQAISKAQEKLQQNQLTIEEILDDEDLVGDLKQPTFSQLTSYLTNEHLFKLIDYITKEPTSEDHNTGHKFPFTACEILASDNSQILERLFEEKFVDEDKSNINEDVEIEKSFKNEKRDSFNYDDNSEEKKSDENLIETKSEPMDNTIRIRETEVEANVQNDLFKEKSKENKIINDQDASTNKTFQIQSNSEDNSDNLAYKNNLNIENNIERNSEYKYSDNENKDDNSNNVSKNIRKTIKNEMLDYFFSFLKNDFELNYVLCGYFLKVFNHLQLNKGSLLQKYIFTMNSDVINNLLKHMNRKSICDALLKILFSPQSENNTCESKAQIIVDILKRFNENNPEECNSICDTLFEILNNKTTFNIVLRSKKILTKLHKLVTKFIKINTINKDLLRVLNKFNENFLKEIHGVATVNQQTNNYDSNFSIPNFNFEEETGLFSKTSTNYDEFDLNTYSFIFDILSESFEKIINDFISDDTNQVFLDNTLKQKHRLLGMKKILELDYIKEIFEIVINAESINFSNPKLNEIMMKAINSNLFEKMIKYFNDHQWNNMYQKSFDSVVNLLHNKYTNKILAKNFFSDCKFLDFITLHIFNKKFKYESGREINDGVFAFLLETAYNVSKSENLYLTEFLTDNTTWRIFINKFVIPIKDRFSKAMVFPQENPFQKSSMENTQNENNFMNKESIGEAIKNCYQQFFELTEIKVERNSVITEVIESSNNVPINDTSNEKDEFSFNNNLYWKIDVKDIDFEIS